MMEKVAFIASLALLNLLMTSVQAAPSPTQITFVKGSYCGNFSGNIKHGKVFRLSLLPDQNFVIRNVGNDRVSMAYVSGPNGRIESERYGNETSFFTQRRGNYTMKIYGSSSHSKVEFCAY